MTKYNLPHDHGPDIGCILEQMPQMDSFLKAAALFQQLADCSRLRILWLLCHCEECGINIAAAVGMSNAAVAHHLKTLKMHGIITSRRAGKEVYYTLADTETALLIHRMMHELLMIGYENG